jgi:phasin family protein
MPDKPAFPFDPEALKDLFKLPDLMQMAKDFRLPEVDSTAIIEAQKRNMDALVEANRAAAAGYQDLFARQLAIFEETMGEARRMLDGIDATRIDAETARSRTELAKAAFARALENMKSLAESAQKANSDAAGIVAERVRASIAELQDLLPGSKG